MAVRGHNKGKMPVGLGLIGAVKRDSSLEMGKYVDQNKSILRESINSIDQGQNNPLQLILGDCLKQGLESVLKSD